MKPEATAEQTGSVAWQIETFSVKAWSSGAYSANAFMWQFSPPPLGRQC